MKVCDTETKQSGPAAALSEGRAQNVKLTVTNPKLYCYACETDGAAAAAVDYEGRPPLSP